MASIDVEIIETVPIKKSKLNVVTGFGRSGFIGSTALMYIIRNGGFTQRAYIKSQLIPPMVLILNGNPNKAFRIYLNDKEDLILVTGETLVPAENFWPIGLKLMDWLLSKGASSFFSIEGLTLGPLYKERMVLGYSNNRKDLGQFGVLPTTEGAISGINAVLFEECLRRGLSWTSLFVPTSRVSTIDYGGAAAIIEVLDKIFHLSVDVSQLKKMEENVRQMYERQMKTGSRGLLGRFRGS